MHLLILAMVVSAPPQVSPAPAKRVQQVACTVPQCTVMPRVKQRSSSMTVRAKECPCSGQCCCGCNVTGYCDCPTSTGRVYLSPIPQPTVYPPHYPSIGTYGGEIFNPPYTTQRAFVGGGFFSRGGGCGPGG